MSVDRKIDSGPIQITRRWAIAGFLLAPAIVACGIPNEICDTIPTDSGPSTLCNRVKEHPETGNYTFPIKASEIDAIPGPFKGFGQGLTDDLSEVLTYRWQTQSPDVILFNFRLIHVINRSFFLSLKDDTTQLKYALTLPLRDEWSPRLHASNPKVDTQIRIEWTNWEFTLFSWNGQSAIRSFK